MPLSAERQSGAGPAHWPRVLPLEILAIDYEKLVSDPEGESRRLIEFLGLEWEPACLDFHRTERPNLTASAWQVRQPLYRRSVGRWQHYERHLAPLLDVLKAERLPAVGFSYNSAQFRRLRAR